jgi:hypothetical protein
MSKSKTTGLLESAVRVVLAILLGFVGFVFSQSLFMLFFVPVVVYYLWSTHNKTKELERRLAELDKAKPAIELQ